ncbi:uncharacterized protein LACBIDRAFT_303216 [Laccaria bicolor S238N-H82]|uniref:Predicted protein n=1 Tax=Laccaria bicolor (strain S238N-H82 / ATCC MYA-4686) TaxID=486041 RepID=B0DJ53_LACBS|nr:uncharacterized protein LACBIDRAFT_303216 [Laccaria bicolor S238N-H82]EDR05344.1 predicted protein [Laccaria bicolor S238N-H82]|eukprot:XP_001883902.1 predicted protein [Laccaria bicolor S238N-H82]
MRVIGRVLTNGLYKGVNYTNSSPTLSIFLQRNALSFPRTIPHMHWIRLCSTMISSPSSWVEPLPFSPIIQPVAGWEFWRSITGSSCRARMALLHTVCVASMKRAEGQTLARRSAYRHLPFRSLNDDLAHHDEDDGCDDYMTTTTLMTARPTTRIRSSVRAFTFRSSWATEQTEISTQKRDLPIYPSAPEPKSPVVRSNGPSTLENPNLVITPAFHAHLTPSSKAGRLFQQLSAKHKGTKCSLGPTVTMCHSNIRDESIHLRYFTFNCASPPVLSP